MKLASTPLCLILASAALALAGCTKKPMRPTPLETAPMGPASLAPTDVPTQAPGTDLVDRGNEWIGDQNRTALAANTVYFDFDQNAIKASEREKLKAAKDYLDKNPGYRLILEGHCDWRGTSE